MASRLASGADRIKSYHLGPPRASQQSAKRVELQVRHQGGAATAGPDVGARENIGAEWTTAAPELEQTSAQRPSINL